VKTVFTDPTNACLTVATLKDFLVITDADSDTLLGLLLPAATRDVMGYTKRSIATRTVTLWLDAEEIQGGQVRLHHGPVQSVTSVTNYEEDETANEIPDTNYWLSATDWLVGKNSGFTYRIGRNADAVKVIYEAGYADDPTAPEATDDSYAIGQLVHAIKLRVADLYEQRTSDEVGTVVAVSKHTTWKDIARPFKQLPLI